MKPPPAQAFFFAGAVAKKWLKEKFGMKSPPTLPKSAKKKSGLEAANTFPQNPFFAAEL